jgi:fused signal recognition particle receptor
MFSYLRDKLTGDEDDEDIEAGDQEDTEVDEEPQEEPQEADESVEQQGSEEQKGFLSRAKDAVLNKTIDDDVFDDVFWELEKILLTNNVAQPVVEALKSHLRDELVGEEVRRGDVEGKLRSSLREAVRSVLDEPERSLLEWTDELQPLKILLIGVNGSGKTTTAAKLVHYLQGHEKTCVVGAADTYRAAAIQQLEEHTDNLGTKLIKHDYGADPAAVAYDTVQHGESAGKDVCVIDTAGRLHTDDNLMQQLAKIKRVSEPHLTLYVAESVTGNDAVRQLEQFQEHLSVDGVIMTKADADDKGGAILSVSYVTGSPIFFLGNGQEYEDLIAFNADDILDELGL